MLNTPEVLILKPKTYWDYRESLRGRGVVLNQIKPVTVINSKEREDFFFSHVETENSSAVEEWKNGKDLVYIHIEAPDECGHRNEPENKVRAIELIDEKVLPIILDYLNGCGEDYKIMILPDHPTPIVTQTHAGDPVPFMIYHKNAETDSGVDSINENSAKATGDYVAVGHTLMKEFLEG